MRLDVARALKKNQEISGSAGLQTPLSAAARTVCMYKHTCIHCRGMVPCVPETLVAVASDGMETRGSATSATAEVGEDVATSTTENGAAVSGEGDEWRDAYAEDET